MKLNYFYWDKCYYCKEFQPVMNHLKSYLDRNDQISVQEFERSEQGFQNASKQFKVQYFPTLAYENNGSIHEVDIDRYKSKYKSSKQIAKAIYSELIQSQTGGGAEQYKEKYLKYKQKYLELKNNL